MAHESNRDLALRHKDKTGLGGAQKKSWHKRAMRKDVMKETKLHKSYFKQTRSYRFRREIMHLCRQMNVENPLKNDRLLSESVDTAGPSIKRSNVSNENLSSRKEENIVMDYHRHGVNPSSATRLIKRNEIKMQSFLQNLKQIKPFKKYPLNQKFSQT